MVFAVMHGKTRRGALVFDVADLIKKHSCLPWAFICAKEQATEQEFPAAVSYSTSLNIKALDFMFNTVKADEQRRFVAMMVAFIAQCEEKSS